MLRKLSQALLLVSPIYLGFPMQVIFTSQGEKRMNLYYRNIGEKLHTVPCACAVLEILFYMIRSTNINYLKRDQVGSDKMLSTGLWLNKLI